MRRVVLAFCLLPLAAPLSAQEPPSPFITDPEALDRRYGVGGEGRSRALGPAEGAAAQGDRGGREPIDQRRRGNPRAVGRDLVDDRGVVQPGAAPFFRF